MVTSFDTKFLTDVINPIYVFSGDDHDFCDVTHNFRYPEVWNVMCFCVIVVS
jgi:hypothetical protein